MPMVRGLDDLPEPFEPPDPDDEHAGAAVGGARGGGSANIRPRGWEVAYSVAHSRRYCGSRDAAASVEPPSNAGKTGAWGAMNIRSCGSRPRPAARIMPATLLDSSV